MIKARSKIEAGHLADHCYLDLNDKRSTLIFLAINQHNFKWKQHQYTIMGSSFK